MRFELPTGKKLVHQMVVPLRWGDMDAMGHINNTLYFRYMEIARLEWIFEVSGRGKLAGEGPVIINAFCNFLRQLEFPGDLRVKTYVAHPGRTSFESYHVMERSDEPGVTCAEGGARIVWSDYATRKSAPLPDWFRALLV
jgi:acyl-CoA thioester hydrolase